MLFLLAACISPDHTAPRVFVESPRREEAIEGYRFLEVEVSVDDDRKAPIDVEVLVDGEVLGLATVRDCEQETCLAFVVVDLDDFPEGVHRVGARAIDAAGNADEDPGVDITVWDVPYIDEITVHDSQESGFNGPDLEVEVHLEDESGVWRGCAALESVDLDDRMFRDLLAPFVLDGFGRAVRWDDLLDAPLRLVVVESDAGVHCPVPYDLGDDPLVDDDDLYGFGPFLDFTEIDGEVELTFDDVTGLVLARGRPRGRWAR
ncbi:MAG: hypothetical protein R3F61_02980 [Myxococcota bacterium]